MKMENVIHKLAEALQDNTLKLDLAEFLNKFRHKGFGTNTYDLADTTRKANLHAVSRFLDFLFPEGAFSITPSTLTINGEDDLRAINAIKSLSLLKRDEKNPMLYTLQVSAG